MDNNTQIVPSVYTDFANIGFNIYNFTLYFGSVEENTNQLIGKIKMSPETAKSLRDMLDKNVQTYEETYGTINVFDEAAKEKEKELRDKKLTKAEMDKKIEEELPEPVKEKSAE